MYKMKIIKIKDEKQIEIPKIPFVISTGGNSYYIISELNSTNNYILTSIEGTSYSDKNYTKEYIIENINKGIWILMKSKLEILQ